MEDRTRQSKARLSRNSAAKSAPSSSTTPSKESQTTHIESQLDQASSSRPIRRSTRRSLTSTSTLAAAAAGAAQSTIRTAQFPSTPAFRLPTTSSSDKRQARTSNASDNSSLYSQRGQSPFSNPATPATGYSISSTVSSSSSHPASKGDKAKDLSKPAIPSDSSTSHFAAAAGKQVDPSSRSNGKGKHKVGASSVSTATNLADKGKKRARSASPLATAQQQPKAKARKSEPVAPSTYLLRSRTKAIASGSMVNSKQSGVEDGASAAASKVSEASVKGKSTRTKSAKTGANEAAVTAAAAAAAAAASSSCAVEGTAMNVDSVDSEIGRVIQEDDEDGFEDEEEGHEDQEMDDDEEEENARRTLEMEEDEEGDEDEDDEDGHYDDEMGDPYGDGNEGASGGFGSHLRAMAGYMSGLAGKFRTLLASIRDRKDPSSQLVALQELSEVLSISNEDTLAGYFPTESFVTELIYLMGGPKPPTPSTLASADSSKTKKEEEEDEDEEMAAALAAAAGVEDNGEKMLLACRCLANLIEAMPYAAHSIVSLGAVPILNSKLMEIEFIDLAEQVLQTLEKISGEYPSAIVREDGLQAMLQYLDFFNIHVQRTAMNAAANCCRRLSAESFPKVKDIMPIIKNVLSYSDQRLVESACRCIVRLVESYRHQGELLEQLLTDDLVASINAILLPSSTSIGSTSTAVASTTVNTSTYTDVLKALGVAARVSPKTAVTLLENNVVETLYHLLTGSPAPDEDGQGGKGPAVSLALQGAEQDIGVATMAVVLSNGQETVAAADVAVLQNLANRPKEQVQEALSLVAELLPPLPRSGVFDPRMYTEKAYLKRKQKLARAVKQAKEAEKNSHRVILMEKTGSEESSNADVVEVVTASVKVEKPKSDREIAKEQAQAKRVDTLKDRQGLVKRFTQLVLPTLVEVYAASVALHVRSKALFGILKIVSFVEPDPLMGALDNVALASFVAAILSSRDHPTLVQGALQLVEMLTIKLPTVYSALLRREGVMWEIEDIASKHPSVKMAKSKSGAKNSAPEATATNVTGATSLVLPGTSAGTEAEVSRSEAAEQSASTVSASTLTALATTSDLSRLLAGAGVQGLSRLAGRLPSSSASNPALANAVTSSTLLSVSGQPTTLVEAEDSNIWRARILRDQFAPEASRASSGGADEAGRALEEIKSLVKKLQTTCTLNEDVARETLQQTATLFAKADNPISSFELLRSGMINGMYTFAVGDSSKVPRTKRRELLMEALMYHQGHNVGATTAASALVRRLQETLSRLENFDITTAINNSADESRRSPTANVARQIRLKLVADNEDGDIPRNCTNLIVSIHAITSFQSLNDYLRPKIATSQAMSSLAGATSSSADGALGSGSNLSGALAAFASSAGFELYPSLRNSLAAASSSATSSLVKPSTSSSSAEIKKEDDGLSSSSQNAGQSSVDTARKGKKANEETGKRRSSRLSAKEDEESKGEDKMVKAEVEESHDERMDEALARRLVEGLLQDEMEGLEDEGGFTDEDEYEDEDIIEEGPMPGMESAGSSADRTIHLDVAQDGSKVEAKTPDGTRVATPINELSRSAPTSSSTPITTSKASYASALQKRPIDWHLEFQMEGQNISLDSTIYSAIHRYEKERQNSEQSSSGSTGNSAASTPRYIWSNTYTVKYRKVPGPVPSTKAETATSALAKSDSSLAKSIVELPASIAETASYARILQLLRVLYDLNSEWKADTMHHAMDSSASKGLNEAAFVNNKLTAKLNRQLEEPMIVASNCMPGWSLDLPRCFPFLFPFEVRYAFLQSTSFGYHRLINKWQNQQSRNQDASASLTGNSRHDDSLALLGRLTRQKVRISRGNLLASAFKVLELYGTNTSLLEVEYFDEVGTGLGPTLEFYALVSKEFARRDQKLWRSDDAASTGDYVFSPTGLFPLPSSAANLETAEGKSKVHSFKILGQFVAKALFDSRIVDMHFSTMFMRAVIRLPIPETLSMLRNVDAALAHSLQQLTTLNGEDLESLGLDFTLPGHVDYELHPGGQDEVVIEGNLQQYIREVIHHTLIQGVAPFVDAFREGFNMIFPIAAMSIFKEEELVMLFGNSEEDWSEATLLSSIKPDHGYNADSATFRDVISIMSQFNPEERRDFLQWMTGSPKLPIGGFSGLHPPLTIVKRPPEANADPDKTLPSVMTCVNFCKLPPFSSKEIMKSRLLLAIKEGQASFHLS